MAVLGEGGGNGQTTDSESGLDLIPLHPIVWDPSPSLHKAYSPQRKRLLKEAREKRDSARKLITDGIDPSENKKVVKAARAESMVNTFEVIACEWGLKKQKYIGVFMSGFA